MARIPYKNDDEVGPEEVVAPIRERRGGRLLNLDRILLYSPPFAKGWNGFLGAVRNELILPPKLRELAICTVAVLNGAEYEFHHHAPELMKAGGTEGQVKALRQFTREFDDGGVFNTAEHAVIQLTVEMTRDIRVSDSTFAAVKSALPHERQVVELIGIIATYNMVSRLLVALDVEPEKT